MATRRLDEMQLFSITESQHYGLDPAAQLRSEIKAFLTGSRYFRTPTVEHGFFVFTVNVTPLILNLFIDLLNVKLPLGVKGEERKWREVLFDKCCINQCSAAENTSGIENDKYKYVAPNDMSRLGTTLARRVVELKIEDSPGLADCVLRAPRLDMNKLSIRLDSGLNPSECIRLGTVLKHSVNLKILITYGTPLESGLNLLADGLPDAIHLEWLELDGFSLVNRTKRRVGLTHFSVGLSQLLQNPKSQLKRLELESLDLKDEDLMIIAPSLCIQSNNQDQPSSKTNHWCSRLEDLKVTFNDFTPRSILDFAHRLPDMPFLRTLHLHHNVWRVGFNKEEGMAALVQAVLQNNSIECVNPSEKHSQTKQLYHHLLWNKVRRRILTTFDPIPLGLWAHILERVGSTPCPFSSEREVDILFSENERQASAVYYLLNNGPIKGLLFHDG